jgi:hypothetical protein
VVDFETYKLFWGQFRTVFENFGRLRYFCKPHYHEKAATTMEKQTNNAAIKALHEYGLYASHRTPTASCEMKKNGVRRHREQRGAQLFRIRLFLGTSSPNWNRMFLLPSVEFVNLMCIICNFLINLHQNAPIQEPKSAWKKHRCKLIQTAHYYEIQHGVLRSWLMRILIFRITKSVLTV